MEILLIGTIEMRNDNIYSLPENLPVPQDGGECNHLQNTILPDINLMSTSSTKINLKKIKGKSVVFCYPRTGKPDIEPPLGWNDIPGARGCTPQMCTINEKVNYFLNLDISVFGLSTQETEYQQEMVERLNLNFNVLSDCHLDLTKALNLPTFKINDMTLLKRLTLVIENGVIIKVFYPVFPSTESVKNVLDYLNDREF